MKTNNPSTITAKKIVKTSPKMIHCIAFCQVCSWEESWFLAAEKFAVNHTQATGHEVVIEKGTSQRISIK